MLISHFMLALYFMLVSNNPPTRMSTFAQLSTWCMVTCSGTRENIAGIY